MSKAEERRDPTGREPSDVFGTPRARRAIPVLAAIPKTPEELRQIRMRRAIAAVLAILAAVIVGVVAVWLVGRRSIEQARLEAESGGRLSSIERALALLESRTGGGDLALAARLHAAAALEGEPGDHAALGERLLEQHDPTGEGASDHMIARTYLALASGQPGAATQYASSLSPSGPRAAEAGRARALTALAIGNVAQALADARAALAAMPDSPRHAALVAILAARAGEEGPAVDGDAAPLVLARARIRWDRGEERERIAADVAPLLAEGAGASPAERAWASLLTGLSHADQGNTPQAVAALEAAAHAPPPGDELFQILLAEGWLALRRAPEAHAIADRFAPGLSTDAGRRARMTAELHLLEGRLDAAETALSHAEATPRTSLLRARLSDARGQSAAAQPLYEEAARAPSERLEATIALADLLARTSRASEAVALIAPLLSARPTHPRVAAIAASAAAASGDRARGLSIANAALAEHPREPILLAAKGRVHLEASEWQPALEALRLAAEISPEDASLHFDRGRAARGLRQLEEAKAAFATAIERQPTHVAALQALLEVQLETADTSGAQQTLARIDTARIAELSIERLRARYLVDTLAGASGLDAVRRARRTLGRRDRELAYLLARLHVQAERWYDAIDTFEDAMPEASDVSARRDVLLWRMHAYGRARRVSTVEQMIESFREAANEAGVPLTSAEEGRMWAAAAWAHWTDRAFGRAAYFARLALERDAQNADALLILAANDALTGRDESARIAAAINARPPSIEPYGRIALLGEINPERCAAGRRYVRAAPGGALASEVQERLRACPP